MEKQKKEKSVFIEMVGADTNEGRGCTERMGRKGE